MISKENILANLDIIEATLESFANIDTGNIMEYLNQIVSLQATATETLSSCKYLLLEATNKELDRQAKLMGAEKVAPSIKKLRADAMVREWQYYYEKADRYSRNISHTITATISKLVSYRKELENSKYQN